VPPNYVALLPTKTQIIDIPTLPSEYKSVHFFVNALVKFNVTETYEAWPVIDPIDGVILEPWISHGSSWVTGKISLFANDHLLGQSTVGFGLPGGCWGYVPGSCTNTHSPTSYPMGITMDSGYENLGSVNTDDLPIIKAVFDEFRVEGRYNDDRGTIYWANYNGTFTLNDAVTFDVDMVPVPVPVSAVPLPGALGLLITALAALAVVTRKRRKAAVGTRG
jgi:hypothetical protein